jgi:tRNA G18 (ribose-2'-O)-methylase SpoU
MVNHETTDAIDTRNVIDHYKYWKTEAIKADLRDKSHNFSVLITNHFNDFNIGTVIRNANAFCAKDVIIYGRKQYDRRGTVGTHLYANLRHVKLIEELNFGDSIVVGIDNIDGAVPLEDFVWPKQHVIMAFGQEASGLTEEIVKLCSHMVYIKQYGSVRSLNVGCASAVAMYDYCRKVVD